MTAHGAPSRPSLGQCIKASVRGNLGAMFLNQGILAIFNVAILVMVNRVYASEADTSGDGTAEFLVAEGDGVPVGAIVGIHDGPVSY